MDSHNNRKARLLVAEEEKGLRDGQNVYLDRSENSIGHAEAQSRRAGGGVMEVWTFWFSIASLVWLIVLTTRYGIELDKLDMRVWLLEHPEENNGDDEIAEADHE